MQEYWGAELHKDLKVGDDDIDLVDIDEQEQVHPCKLSLHHSPYKNDLKTPVNDHIFQPPQHSIVLNLASELS